MKLSDLKEGMILKGHLWKEPVELKKVEFQDKYARIIGSTLKTNLNIDQYLTEEDLETMNIEEFQIDFSSDSDKVFLALECLRYRYASTYDPMLAVNVSKIVPLPHQIDAVYGRILKNPKIRFLLADDPGAGKTIMAGLLIKELKLRGIVKRMLIVVPGHLKDQWMREMREKFDERFAVITRATIKENYGENVWDKENQIITSIDFAKQEDILSRITNSKFDLIIVDEAHKMSATNYGKIRKTDRYRLGEVLSQRTDHLIFLTATPHQGDADNFRLFLDLLEGGMYSDAKSLQEAIKSGEAPILRRTKESMVNFDGHPIFLPREIKTIEVELSDDEMDLYNDVSRYVKNQFNKALSKEKGRNIGFALVVLQRRFASSLYALDQSLKRRIEKLEKIINNFEEEREKQLAEIEKTDFSEEEDEEEEARWKDEEKWEALSVAENRAELRIEIEMLKKLSERASALISHGEESKFKGLKKAITALLTTHPESKLLIFTESKDTLKYLVQKIKGLGYKANQIDGGMSLEDRVHAEHVFKNETQILIATEAAGEGINLQFCNLMINYDLPWNPNRLEQRMGRIHRYGQNKEVLVSNLCAKGTREGDVLKAVFDKLNEIKTAMGKDSVFDVIGKILSSMNMDLERVLTEAAAGARSREEIISQLKAKPVSELVARMKADLDECLATDFIDYTLIKEIRRKAEEEKLIPQYTRDFFIKGISLYGGQLRERKDGNYSLESVPSELRVISKEDEFRKKGLTSIASSYPNITFDKEKSSKDSSVELVSFGHPLFEALMASIERDFGPEIRRGAMFSDPDCAINGNIFFFEGEVRDGLGQIAGRKLFSVLVGDDGSCSPIPPSKIWEFSNYDEPIVPYGKDRIMGEIAKARASVLDETSAYLKALLSERRRRSEIRRKYGDKSLNTLLAEIDSKIISYTERASQGNNVDLQLRLKKDDLARYQRAQRELHDTCEREIALSRSSPRFVGAIRVIPKRGVSPDIMRSDKTVEDIGMKMAFIAEEEAGWSPEDVSKENLGFDIRSRKGEEVKYIEVKARAGVGKISMTKNEWFKAERFGDSYFLYVVYNAIPSRKPDLHVIKNPFKSLRPERRTEEVRFLIDKDQILSSGK